MCTPLCSRSYCNISLFRARLPWHNRTYQRSYGLVDSRYSITLVRAQLDPGTSRTSGHVHHGVIATQQCFNELEQGPAIIPARLLHLTRQCLLQPANAMFLCGVLPASSAIPVTGGRHPDVLAQRDAVLAASMIDASVVLARSRRASRQADDKGSRNLISQPPGFGTPVPRQ